jgi:monofunctional biosynthetic peptidoglycan transglycosylase
MPVGQAVSEEGRGRPRAGKLIRRGLLLLLLVGAGWLWFIWPPPAWYRWAWPRETAFMAMRGHGSEGAAGKRPAKPLMRDYQPVALQQIAPVMQEAVLAGEDQRFYSHSGIDYIEFRHALGYRPDSFSWRRPRDRAQLWRALRQAWERRGRLRGASTISQQLAKNLYLSASRNPLRKLKEVITAWRLEYWLGKERILELYLNVAELGPGVWGVEAASRRYFGHGAARLSLEEAAALAGTLPFPLSSNPGSRPGRMRWRQSMIIRRLRGEDVMIPPVLDSLPDIPPDTLKAVPDTLPDSLKVKPDTVIDTLPAPRDTTFSRPAGAASPASYSWPDRPSPPARRSRRAPGP